MNAAQASQRPPARGTRAWLIGIAIALAAGTLCLALWAQRAISGNPPDAARTSAGYEPGPGGPPRLQADPARDLETYLRRERALLDSYGWIDRKKGLVRIPIERAMEILLQRGFPVREAAGVPEKEK